MHNESSWWEIATFEKSALVGGAVGLAEGLRAVAATSGTFLQEFTVISLSAVIGSWTSAIVLPPTIRLLRQCVGSVCSDEPSSSEVSRARLLVIAAFMGVAASLLGLVLEDVFSILVPGRRIVHGVLAFGGVLSVFWVGRRLVSRRLGAHRARVITAATVCVVLCAIALHMAGISNELPSSINTGNGLPITTNIPWADRPPPNILFVVLDTTRLDRLTLYGYPLSTSPELDRIASEATVFDRAISTAPWTLPSHASMFTGLLPRVHQATEEHRTLRNEFTTLAEILLAHGYETVGFSSNSVVGRSHNLHQGFQEFYEVSGDIWFRPQSPFQELLIVRVIERFIGGFFWKDKGAARCNFLADRWLDHWQRRDDRRPFFAFVNYLEAHLPYHPPADRAEEFGVGTVRPVLRPLISTRFNHGDIYRLIGYRSLLVQEDYDQLGALYDASLAYQDQRLGELIDGLRRRALLDDTVVIIVSDHGENLGDHGGLLGHALSIHQTLIHVPLVIRYPLVFPPGARNPSVVSIAGLFQTVLSLAGAQPDPTWPPNVGPLPTGGEPMQGHAFSEYATPVWELYSLAVEARGVDIGPMLVRKRSIQNTDWKVIEPSQGSPSLYHLVDDPEELSPTDATIEPEGRELLSRLATELDGLPRPELQPVDAPPQLDDATRAALKALGYME